MPNSNDFCPPWPSIRDNCHRSIRILAGPYSLMLRTRRSRDKVESPGIGDDAREYGPFVNGKSAYFQSVNREGKYCTQFEG
ncbi:MAG: hypothetical protein CM15mP62_19040 [Rhodospirillaceae bacterium]|nr:MAG: hypothetical protein CM15mP62_19040 [Rhodospirillaceae bacterium]